ncbi:MAG: hypothetical protein CSA45_01945 [Gammaproteobacteria bacterium]|nr:MAG: hypothetical protein CSA45_01945 [Gammaproteobacteria bacterium]
MNLGFLLLIITAIGCLVIFQYVLFSEKYTLSNPLYLIFVVMTALNVIFPHLLSAIVMRKYVLTQIGLCHDFYKNKNRCWSATPKTRFHVFVKLTV